MEVAVLPALALITEAEDVGRSRMDALGDALPLLLNATALTMPCREMCEAVVQTCRRAPHTLPPAMRSWNVSEAARMRPALPVQTIQCCASSS